MTGADLYALCSDAMLNAISRTIGRIDTGHQLFSDVVLGLRPVHTAWLDKTMLRNDTTPTDVVTSMSM